MKNLLLLIAVSLLCSCYFSKTEAKKDAVVKCCEGLSLSSLAKAELVNCGILYWGNGYSRSFLQKSNLNESKIISCAKKSKNQGKSFLVQYELSYMPDLESSTFAIFESDGNGIVVIYENDGGTNHSVSVKRCSPLMLSKQAGITQENCIPSLELIEKLIGSKKNI